MLSTMVYKRRKHRQWSWIRGTLVFFAFIIACGMYVGVVFGSPQDNSKGWIWNAYRFASPNTDLTLGLGWTSMNCLNDFDNDGLLEYQCDPARPYGLGVATGADGTLNGTDDYLQGCAWSSEYGWLCFNGGPGASYQCDSTGEAACGDLSTNGVSIRAYNQSGSNWFYHLESPGYNGGAWGALTNTERAVILSLWKGTGNDEDQGYIGFPTEPENFDTASTSKEGMLYGCFGCGKKCSTNKSVTCTSDADCSGGTCRNYCNACLNASTENEAPDGDPLANPNPNLLCWDCGNGASQCTIGDSESSGSCVTNRDKNKCLYSSCTGGCTDYTGVIVNEVKPQQYELCGWGYHAYTKDAVTKGLGWIAFNSEQKLGDTTFIDVKEGSIFSGGNIYSPSGPPVGRYNAAYIIEASGSITNWFSRNSYLFSQRSNAPSFIKKQTSGVYSNVFGRLDYAGLITAVKDGQPAYLSTCSPGVDCTNKYGMSILPELITPRLDTPLLDRVIFSLETRSEAPSGVHTDPTYGTTVQCGENQNQNGAGIIVIDNDLYIDHNISYESCAPEKLKQIPSLVWIVKGDVVINPTVTSIAGTFIVLGKDGAGTCPAVSSTALPGGCGRFSTGDSSSQLVINGSVLARQFNFQRSHSKEGVNLEPAEEFRPDGRLQANAPTGLLDFVKAVPRFSTGF